MACYLLTWNHKKFRNDSDESWYRDGPSIVRRKGFDDRRWSCGRNKRIQLGDCVFMLRQGEDPRGILASGEVIGASKSDRHWNPDSPVGATSQYVEVRWRAMADARAEGVLTLHEISQDPAIKVHWRTQSSGIRIDDDSAARLEILWRTFLVRNGHTDPGTGPVRRLYSEGEQRRVEVNSYNRNPRAREACLQIYGWSCGVCKFDFHAFYGDIGERFIHVHHLKQVSDNEGPYEIDPKTDLLPVCPNCHAMIHRGGGVLEIEELKRHIKRDTPFDK